MAVFKNEIYMVELIDMIEAYEDCLRGKRSTRAAHEYAMTWERSLVDLCRRINDGTYKPGTSVCFIVRSPKRREVFAAAFEDRIVQHWISLRLEPVLERIFSDRSFSCRKGKGRLYGVQRLAADVLECSEGWTRDCWIMRADLRNCFMSVDRALMAEVADALIVREYSGRTDTEDLRRLTRLTIMHAPERDCTLHSPAEWWNDLDPAKSLFTNGDGKGLAIGNKTSQLLINLLLDALDRFVLNDLGFRFYGRYVDDFYIVDRDKSRMLEAMPKIRGFLAGIGIALHPRKFQIQHYTKGAAFTGAVVKPGRTYAGNRTVHGFRRAVGRLNAVTDPRRLEAAVSSVNSYLGLLRHHASYNIRRETISGLDPGLFRWIYIRGRFESVAVRKRYTRRGRTLARIRDGTA